MLCQDFPFQLTYLERLMTLFFLRSTSSLCECKNNLTCAGKFPGFNNWKGYPDKLLIEKVPRGGSKAAATSKMECFVTIVNGWKPLTIITRHSILDVAAALDPPLVPGSNLPISTNSNIIVKDEMNTPHRHRT